MEILDLFLHVDRYLAQLVSFLGVWVYVLLFAIVFAETGFVVTPFLPGDSLLFAVGTLAGSGLLDIKVAYITLLLAGILGDTVNYWIGHFLGPKVFAKENSRFFKREYLEKTRAFFAKHGGKTIILARFVPIVRTFAPFVAGIGQMNYSTFLFYNVVGAFAWVSSLTLGGYFLGSLPVVKNNFEYAVFLIVFFSLIPVIVESIKHKHQERSSHRSKETTYQDIRKVVEE